MALCLLLAAAYPAFGQAPLLVLAGPAHAQILPPAHAQDTVTADPAHSPDGC